MAGIIALLTDFGVRDPYLAQMKSVILDMMPDCRLLDISHEIEPHNVKQGGFFLESTWAYLPRDTVCTAVVDPGVGTERKILLLKKNDRFLLAPDNGLISPILKLDGSNSLWSINLDKTLENVSLTFHGRDIFAPLAVKIARKVPPRWLGSELDQKDAEIIPEMEPKQSADKVESTVLHIDRFGNCILNLSSKGWSTRILNCEKIQLIEPKMLLVQPVETYQQIYDSSLGILKGSQGYMEIARKQGSCADYLGLSVGDKCLLQLKESQT